MEDNLKILAETALISKNYEQAYNYYSQLLERNTNNKDYWKGKAYAACNLSNLDQSRVFEAITLLNAANKILQISDLEKAEISNELLKVGEIKLKEGIHQFETEVEKRFNLLQIPAGTLYEVHKTRKLKIKIDVGAQYRPALIEIFELMAFACDLCPTKENYKRLISNFNRIFEHSKSNLDYFGGLNTATELNSKTLNIWNQASNKLRELDPSFLIEDHSPKPSSGCFIATAATGDYNNIDVLILRDFRDNTLCKSKRGQRFIESYYRNSPPIADFISNRPIFKKIVLHLFIHPLAIISRIVD
jgi:hypothetical protein